MGLKFCSRTLWQLACLTNFSKSIRYINFYHFSLDNPPISIIYPYKFTNVPFILLGALGSHIGVKMTIFGCTPQVMAGSNISWESSAPIKHISLFLRVNKEGLCDGTKVSGIVFLVISSL